MGLAGLGSMGRRRRDVLARHPGVAFAGACDPAAPDADCASLDELLARPLDALFVCVPTCDAADATVAGLRRGLHVFCEKPPGRDLADVERVRRAEARDPSLRLAYGFNHRRHGSVARAREVVASGRLGRVVNLRAVYGKAGPRGGGGGWRWARATAGGGILLDQGIHMVDLLRVFAGEFVEVAAFVDGAALGGDVEYNAYALLRAESGAVAMLHSSATEWRHRFRLEIALERGALELAGILSSTMRYAPETLTVVELAEDGTPGEPSVETFAVDRSLDEEVDAFVRAVSSGEPVRDGSSDDALAAMALVERIYRADPRWRGRLEGPLLAEAVS